MTAAEAYDLTTQGGTTDFARVVSACEAAGAWCLIGGLAVNTYVEPLYTLDADLVVVSTGLGGLADKLRSEGFATEEHEHSLNAQGAGSDLRIPFTTDLRYQPFPERAVDAVVLGVRVRVACLEDVTQGKLWAYGDPRRRLSKRKKDELDLIRLAEAWPRLRGMYPAELLAEIDRG
jgi:hypothetical protein